MGKREELIKELFKNVSIKDCYANERENRVTIEDEVCCKRFEKGSHINLKISDNYVIRLKVINKGYKFGKLFCEIEGIYKSLFLKTIYYKNYLLTKYFSEKKYDYLMFDEKTFDIFFTCPAPIILNETVLDIFSSFMIELKLIACKYNTDRNKFAYKFEVVNSYVENVFEESEE